MQWATKKLLKRILHCSEPPTGGIVPFRKLLQEMTPLRPGDPAPDFSGLNENGETISLSDFKGKKLILFFYPQDNTPTCTTEVCNLRDHYAALKSKGFELLGVSPDSTKKHTNFKKKYNLPFPLLADTAHEVIKKYGVWGPKQLFGVSYEGLLRTTFVINEAAEIERVITEVVAKNHAQQLLERI